MGKGEFCQEERTSDMLKLRRPALSRCQPPSRVARRSSAQSLNPVHYRAVSSTRLVHQLQDADRLRFSSFPSGTALLALMHPQLSTCNGQTDEVRIAESHLERRGSVIVIVQQSELECGEKSARAAKCQWEHRKTTEGAAKLFGKAECPFGKRPVN